MGLVTEIGTCAAAMRFLIFSFVITLVVTVVHSAPNGPNNPDLDQVHDQDIQAQQPDSEDDEDLLRSTYQCKMGGYAISSIKGVCLKSKRQCLKRKNKGWKLSMKGGRHFCGKSMHCCILLSSGK